jgi:hypothetical protein
MNYELSTTVFRVCLTRALLSLSLSLSYPFPSLTTVQTVQIKLTDAQGSDLNSIEALLCRSVNVAYVANSLSQPNLRFEHFINQNCSVQFALPDLLERKQTFAFQSKQPLTDSFTWSSPPSPSLVLSFKSGANSSVNRSKSVSRSRSTTIISFQIKPTISIRFDTIARVRFLSLSLSLLLNCHFHVCTCFSTLFTVGQQSQKRKWPLLLRCSRLVKGCSVLESYFLFALFCVLRPLPPKTLILSLFTAFLMQFR